MSGIVLFNYKDKDQKEWLVKLFRDKFPKQKVHYITSEDYFFKQVRHCNADLVVFNWNAHPYPVKILEAYYKNLKNTTPLVIYYSQTQPGELLLMKEFNAQDHAIFIKDLSKPYQFGELLAVAYDVFKKFGIQNIHRHMELLFHYYIKNNRFKEAKLAIKHLFLQPRNGDEDYYQAIIYKKQGKLDDALKTVLNAIKKGGGQSVKTSHLLGSICFARGEWKNAINWLQKAQQASPFHLYRLYMIYKSFDQLGQHEASMNTLKELFRMCPSYRRIVKYIIDGIYQKIETGAEFTEMEAFLEEATDRELTDILKKFDAYRGQWRGQFRDMLIRVLSANANRYIREDNWLALKYYEYIEKMMNEIDETGDRYLTLQYCFARAYFRFGQYSMAKERVSIILNEDSSYEKALELDKKIEWGLEGKIDTIDPESVMRKRKEKQKEKAKKLKSKAKDIKKKSKKN